jgi:tRNA(fMet)-specific endonuclease VapC
MYLLDTNIISKIQRGDKKVIQKLNSISIHHISICTIVLAECYFGAYNNQKRTTELLEYYNNAFIDLNIYDFDTKSGIAYAQLKSELYSKGQLIDDMDMLIASIAISNNLILVTNNLKHFNNIKGLKVEDWSN